MDVADEVKALALEVRDMGRRLEGGIAEIRADLAGFRGEMAGFRGETRNDLRWIKGIGAALLAGSGWVFWNAAIATAEVRHQGTRLEKLEKLQEAPRIPAPSPSRTPDASPKAGG
jgi:hypothetical protein